MKSFAAIFSILVLLISSCSQLEWQEGKHSGRSLSSVTVQRVEDIQNFLESIDAQKKQRFDSLLEIYKWEQGEFVGLGHREVRWGQDQGPKSFKLDQYDTILQVEILRDFLLVRTYFGILLKVHKNTVEVVQAGFPVASFEYRDDVLKLYSKNGQGRFCDEEELKRPVSRRDPSCQFVAAELLLD